MTIRKLGYQWYEITEIVGLDVLHKQYMYYTKKEAIQLFKRDFEDVYILLNEERQDRKW